MRFRPLTGIDPGGGPGDGHSGSHPRSHPGIDPGVDPEGVLEAARILLRHLMIGQRVHLAQWALGAFPEAPPCHSSQFLHDHQGLKGMILLGEFF